VDLLALGKAGHDLFKKSNKLRTGVTRRGLARTWPVLVLSVD
jgi:hypothetical protein